MPTHGITPDLWPSPTLRLKELHMHEHGLEVTFEGSVISVVAEGLADEFRKAGGVNYVTWDLHAKDLGWFTLTMQRRAGETPEQQARERLATIARLRAGMQAVIEGTYPHALKGTKCEHGLWYFVTCGQCIDDHLTAVLADE